MCDEREQHRPHTENVVLELGAELGALVVYADGSLLHEEIEISPAADDGRRSHKDVLERRIGTRSLYAAVFDRVEHGMYTLWHRGAAVRRGVVVAGGRVAECTLAEEASSRA